MEYKIDFDLLQNDFPFHGVIEKSIETAVMKIIKIRFASAWISNFCQKCHYGFGIDGNIEIEFESRSIIFHKGDGIIIPGGKNHRHRMIISEYAEMFLIEFIKTI